MTLIGSRIGRIRLTEFLGEGGMGEVYAGLDETLGRRVAVKVIHARYRLNEEARARLTREARVLSQLDHPNICRLYDFIEGGDADYLVLELIEGRRLRDVVTEGKLSFGAKLRIAEEIASVLVEAHRRGIIHRDLKPENVMILATGDAKVLDFGLARLAGAPRESSGLVSTAAHGNPRTMNDAQ